MKKTMHSMLAVIVWLAFAGVTVAGVDPAVPGDYTAIISADSDMQADESPVGAAGNGDATGVMISIGEIAAVWSDVPGFAQAAMLVLFMLALLPHAVAVLQTLFPRYFDSRTWDDWIIKHGGIIGLSARGLWRLLLARYGQRL